MDEKKEMQEFVNEVMDNEAKRKEEMNVGGFPNEQAMRDSEAPHPKTIEELTAAIDALVERPHDYGTCVYAMSIAAVAAFNFVAHKLGVTGFQASCADLDILRRTRRIKRFNIVNFDNLLYPQYAHDFEMTFEKVLEENKDWLADEARELLQKNNPHNGVKEHWMRLAELK